MIFLKTYKQLFSYKDNTTVDRSILKKRINYNIFTMFSSTSFFIFAIYWLSNQNYSLFGVFLVTAIVLFISTFSVSNQSNFTKITFIQVSISAILFLVFVIFTETSEYLLVLLFFPPLSIFLLESKWSITFNFIFLLASLLIKYFKTDAITLSQLFVFSFLYAFLFFIIYTYQRRSTRNNLQIEKNALDFQKQISTKNELLSKLSYQLRTPLNNIFAVLNITDKKQLNDIQRDIIDTIQASTNNLIAIVNNFDHTSIGQLDDKKNDNLSFNPQLTVSSTIDLYANNNKNIHFKLDFDSQIPKKLKGNPIRLKQILLYLIEHQINSQINKKTKINISIQNIESKKSKITMGFRFLVSPAHNEEDRASFDLHSIEMDNIKSLIATYGSELHISTRQDEILYAFDLDFATKPKLPEVPLVDLIKKDESINIPNKTKKLEEANVLLVEDNPINQKVMVLSLQKHIKNITIANNGKEALDKFGENKYDIILMDIQMPVMDGIKATQKIREVEQGTNTYTPIIAITANALSGDREVCINVGMDDYVSKPFQLKMVLHIMKRLIEQKTNKN